MQFIDYLALGLEQDLGRTVAPLRPHGQTVSERRERLIAGLLADACLRGGVRVPDAVAPIEIAADLRARQVTTSVSLAAPKEGGAMARLRWLLRQLREAPPQLRVQASFPNVREPTSALLGEAREYPQRLLCPSDSKRAPRGFAVALIRPMGLKAGKSRGSFVGDTRQQVIEFYGDVVQDLRRWQARAPKLPDASGESGTSPPEPEPATSVDEEVERAVAEPGGSETASLRDLPRPESAS